MASDCSIVVQSNWSDLPHDILELISLKLSSFIHLLCMKGVCSSWRRGIAEIRNRKMLTLVFFGASGKDFVKVSKRTKVDYNVYFLSIDEQKKPLRLLKKTLQYGYLVSENRQWIIGSHPNGWLILLKNGKHLCLLNLINEISIPIPNDTICGPNQRLDIVVSYKNLRAILSHNPSRHQDFVMVMITSCPLHWQSFNGDIYFWRNGDSTWTSLGIKEPFGYSDMAFCNYTLYTLKVGRPYIMETWDFNQGLSQKKMTVPLSCVSRYINDYEKRLVLSPSGEIFMAARDRGTRYRWGLLKVDLSQKTCVESNSLNGGVFLYGSPSLLVSSIDVERHGYRPNSIYFVEFGDIKLWMYNFQDDQAREIWDKSEVGTFCYPMHRLSSACWVDLST